MTQRDAIHGLLGRWSVGLMVSVVFASGLASTLPAAGDTGPWEALDMAMKELRACEAEHRACNAAVEAYRQALAAARPAALADAQRAVDEAEKALADAEKAAGLEGAREKLQQSRQARDAKVEQLLADAPTFQEAVKRRDEMQKRIGQLQQRIAELNLEELLELGRLSLEERALGKHIAGSQRAWWKRGEVEPLYRAADADYKAYGAAAGKAPAVKEAGEKIKAARKALDDAIATLPLDSAAGKALLEHQAAAETKVVQAKARVSELEKLLIGGAKTVTVTMRAFDRKAKQEVDKKISLWVPPNCDYIRGVIVAHPMISSLATGQPMRLAAARTALATMVYDNFANDGKESLARLDGVLEKLAAESGHPELRGAPLLLGGLSASVLGTRNVACAVPHRVFGIVHAAGGNMQEMPDDGRGMVQVPFLAHNGEFEWCGPIGGIRPEYGNQTQWVMIREQMLRLWRDRHEHRMTLVVVPNADHGAWDVGLTALFVRKAAEYRLPTEKRDGTTPAVCRPLPVEKGWLTDADLDHPTHEPAPYGSYKGDKNNAFWHFDEEMARAVYEYHKGRFLLPDPTKTHPVPADWPPGRAK